MMLQRQGKTFTIEASALGELLDVPPPDVPALIRQNEITSLCEQGEAEDLGQYRLTFFHGGRRARLIVDETGKVVRRSVIHTGDRPSPRDRSQK